MAKDFTLSFYKEILEQWTDGSRDNITVADYINFHPVTGKWLIIRHDVDRRPENAFRMAWVEWDLGLRATYYFRAPFDLMSIENIAEMGHDIGLHYDGGDFAYKLYRLRKFFKVESWSPHAGKKPSITPLLFNAENITPRTYSTDTGRGQRKYNYYDHVKTNQNVGGLYLNIHPERWNDGLMWYYQWAFDFICNRLKRVIYARTPHKSPSPA